MAAALVLLCAAPAAAQQEAGLLDGLSPDVELFGAANLDSLGQRAFGWGGGGAMHMELGVVQSLGVQLGAAMFVLSGDEQPGSVWWFGWHAGLRWHWSALIDAVPGDAWVDAHHELGRSGSVVRHGFDAGMGYSLIVPESDITLGPFFRVMFADDPVGSHPVLAFGGVSLSFFARRRLYERVPDQDLDGVPDHADECVEAPVGEHEDPDRVGCPAQDSDDDGLVDPIDECTHESMWPHPDESDERRGCPMPDRDGDTVPDAYDDCPDTHAPDGGHPLREGCIEDPYD